MKDFSLKIYRQLLQALLDANYAFYTFEDWCDAKATGRFVILRHDVDLKAENSVATAKIEAEMGIRASYYFRVVPQSNIPHLIVEIAALGHEIGYHYEDMSLFNGDQEKAIEHFSDQLTYFRQFYPVRTICMHGSPTSKWDNKALWQSKSYRDYGIIGEPYFDFLNNPALVDVKYFTDTARMWDGDRFNIRDKRSNISVSNPFNNDSAPEHVTVHSTTDFIAWLQTMPINNTLMITTHPQRWTDNFFQWTLELVFQFLKNQIKRFISLKQKKIMTNQ